MLIGPWPHAGNTNAFQYTGIDFGPQGDVDYDSLNVKWFDAMLKGEDNGFLEEPPVTLFIMGENKWHHENEWPIARTQYTNYYFHSAGNANTSSGDGTLGTQEPGRSEPVDEYVYDPMNPVPTSGGNLMFGPTPPGPFDHRDIETRDDVLVFSTEPLMEAVQVTGPVTVTLYAATSARDTDFTAKLVDVHPDGKVINLADGILRGRYHDSPTFTEFELLTPGTVYQFDIDLWATGNLFLEGHQIRVEISSSNFPKYDRNLKHGQYSPDGHGDPDRQPDDLSQRSVSIAHHAPGNPPLEQGCRPRGWEPPAGLSTPNETIKRSIIREHPSGWVASPLIQARGGQLRRICLLVSAERHRF